MQIGDVVRIIENTNPSLRNGKIKDRGLGRIVNSETTEDLSYHGSSDYQTIYEVHGDDGKKYQGFAYSWKGWPVSYGFTEVWFEDI